MQIVFDVRTGWDDRFHPPETPEPALGE